MMNEQDSGNSLTTAATPRPPIVAGSLPRGVVPTTLEEVRRIAQVAVKAGLLGKVSQYKPEDELVAQATLIVLQGLELEVSPMQALNGIAVVNGRTCVWGKLARALVIKRGHRIREWIEHEDDLEKETHYCEITRGDNGDKGTAKFGIADAKRAKLWSPDAKIKRWNRYDKKEEVVDNDNPWHRYWKRMLTHRAFAYAASDKCAEALLGMYTAEEMVDMEPQDVDRGELEPAPKAPPPAALAEAKEELVPLLNPTLAGFGQMSPPNMRDVLKNVETVMGVAFDLDGLNAIVEKFNAKYDGHIDQQVRANLDVLYDANVARLAKKK